MNMVYCIAHIDLVTQAAHVQFVPEVEIKLHPEYSASLTIKKDPTLSLLTRNCST